ncbi:hypothetical protein HPB49_007324 [Dermacentor silvarum]|uniref:Uncharacterized protein n=1 Tax=Dermacentor silvarum TaxID=543639 RepID=A0ACB8D3Q4_DERSI|nr:hypothetical protein HPB49_007324 [Dermacentor silvarum]
MSSAPSEKRGKVYFEKDEHFGLPRSTARRRRRVAWLPQDQAPASSASTFADHAGASSTSCGVNVQENDEASLDLSMDASGPSAELPSSWEDADATGPTSELSAQDEEWEDDGARPSTPPLDETVFAACLHEYGEETLPNSTTTKGAAILLIMAFVVAHGLPWTALEDLLRLINALFGQRQRVLPTSA